MNRRKFLAALGVGGISVFPTLATALADSAPRRALILKAIVLRPGIFETDGTAMRWEPGPRGGLRCRRAGVELAPGDRLSVRLLDVSMGHHTIGLFAAGRKVHECLSPVVGGALERGEAVTAVVSDSHDEHRLRIDITLDRSLRRGERLPLLSPHLATRGLSAQMLPQTGTSYRRTRAGWHPLV